MSLRLPLFCAVSAIAVSRHDRPAISRQTYIGEQVRADAGVSGFDMVKWISLSATGAIGQMECQAGWRWRAAKLLCHGGWAPLQP
ncbi:hypothetical protein IA54_010940 [Xanthomonas phaseoli pv. syngonii LMG 9055]|uniref:Uncharacterized protein n=1 Tax=Xanthomonas phaseoli pv. syngonii LMG 9055 TaxID=1437878 RepID=A0A1V9GY09_9XANT|nr:hypothetical protein IA54_010940 [Xanthomonas phaseoli pv. syngonii LMG 9055]